MFVYAFVQYWIEQQTQTKQRVKWEIKIKKWNERTNEQQIKFNNIRARLRYRQRDSEWTLNHSRVMMMTTITIIVVVVVNIYVYLHIYMNYIG